MSRAVGTGGRLVKLPCWRAFEVSALNLTEPCHRRWYTTPEMFANGQRLPLGQMQDGAGSVDDVRLPPWARTPEEFVWTNRAALESEFVSNNLHHWIDLIFGSKQQGAAADAAGSALLIHLALVCTDSCPHCVPCVFADNVFYYLTYESECALDQVTDPLIQQSIISQIAHFGQTPVQLFRRAHPARLPAAQCATPMLAAGTSHGVCQAPADELASARSDGDLSTRRRDEQRRDDVVILADEAGAPGVSVLALPGARTIPGRPEPAITANLGIFTALCPPSASSSALALQQSQRASLAASALASATAAASYNAAVVAAATAALARERDSAALAAARPFVMTAAAASCPRDQAMALAVCISGNRLLCVHADSTFVQHRWTPGLTESGLPFEVRVEKTRSLAASSFAVGTTVAAARSPGLPSGSAFAQIYDSPSDGTAASVACAALAGAAQAIAPSSCFALLCGLGEGGVPGAVAGTVSGAHAAAGGAGGAGGGGDALLFSCGYVDGSLRWQLLPAPRGRAQAVSGDTWDARLAGAGDVTCVAACGEGGSSGATDSAFLVTGHGNGQVRLWLVVRHSANGALAQAASTSWSDLGFHNRAHFGAAASNAAVPVAAGEHTDYSCVQQVCTSLRIGPVTAVAASAQAGIIVAGLATGAVSIVSARDGRIHRVVPYPSLLAGRLDAPAEPPAQLSCEVASAPTRLSWNEALDAAAAASARPAAQPPLPAAKHVAVLASGHILVHWSRQRAVATEGTKDMVSSELGLLHVNGTVRRHLRIIAAPGAATSPLPSAPASMASSQPSSPAGSGSLNSRRFRSRLGSETHLPPPPAVTAVESSPDGSVLVIGSSVGELTFLHGLTLEVLGRVTMHQETVDAAAAAQRAAEAALAVATFAAAAAAASAAAAAADEKPTAPSTAASLSAGLRASFASAFGGRRAASKGTPRDVPDGPDATALIDSTTPVAVSAAAAPALGGTAGGGPGATLATQASLSLSGAGLCASLHPSAAVTCLRFTDDHRTLLVGCGDGRLCVVTDSECKARKGFLLCCMLSHITLL